LARFLTTLGTGAGLVVDLAVTRLPELLPLGAVLLFPLERVLVALHDFAVMDGAAPALELVGVQEGCPQS
jgi:hypothetical protein